MSKHFALVFHKYLDPSEKLVRNIHITVDGIPVEFWNPFYPQRSEQVLSKQLQKLEVALPENPEQSFTTHIKAWILPHRKDMKRC